MAKTLQQTHSINSRRTEGVDAALNTKLRRIRREILANEYLTRRRIEDAVTRLLAQLQDDAAVRRAG